MSKKSAPYGTWASPITTESISKGSIEFTNVIVDPITSTVYHVESRPSEEGRCVLVNTLTGNEVVGADWDVRTGVHEYGGAAAIVQGGVAYFSNFKDGRVYRVKEGNDPKAVTPENAAYRFADFAMHPVHTNLLVSILEDHTIDVPSKVVTTLVVINTDTKTLTPLVEGADFYAGPKFSPSGTRLTWIQWNHPDMPWEGSKVHVVDLPSNWDGQNIKNGIHVAGEQSKISAGFPCWASDDTLVFTSDESGYINPWKYTRGKSEALFPTRVDQEFGRPLWELQTFPYVVLDKEGKFAVFTAIKDGRYCLYLVDLFSKTDPRLLDTPYVVISCVRSVSREENSFVFIGKKADEEPSIIKCTFQDLTGTSPPIYVVLKIGRPRPFPKGIVSISQPMTLKTSENTVYVNYYPPNNPEYSGSSVLGELPPCVLNAHGGPTSLNTQELIWDVQYFTSRGWAWLDVNYGGSSGYGRQYINRLVGKWGIVDVQDCIEASQLLSTGPNALIDPKRIMIRGESAGGYTTLAAIAIAPDVTAFAGATSLYGVSGLKPLVEDTHKFESKYLFKLIGGTPEQVPDIYEDRSPINRVDRIVSPLLILQGDIDKIVPKEQAEHIYERLKELGRVVQYKLYPGEGHGWCKEETIRDALERELKFYEDVLGLKK